MGRSINKKLNILKIILFIVINFVFLYLIYFISIRPLSPGEEQIVRNFEGKTLLNFTFECIFFILIIGTMFSFLSFMLFYLLIQKKNLSKSFILIFAFYFLFTTICSVDYFLFIKNLIF